MKARTKKILIAEELPEFTASIENMPEESKIFVDKSVEIAHYIFQLMEQKGMKQKDLAAKLGKSEAEVSKWLAGMHNFTLRSIAKLEAALEGEIISTPKQSFHFVRNTERYKSWIEVEEYEKKGQLKPLDYTKGKLVMMECSKDYNSNTLKAI